MSATRVMRTVSICFMLSMMRLLFLYADVNNGILGERQKQSLFHKMGRKVLDFLKISTPTLEQERDAEMLPHVIAAHNAIKNARKAIDVARDNASKVNNAMSART